MKKIVFVGESVGLGKNDYGDAGIFYAWFLAAKIKYCVVINDYGVILSKRSFKGYSEEHRMINFEDFISLSEAKTLSGRFSIDWTKTFEGNKIPHRRQNCLGCANEKNCSKYVIEPILNCFNCKLEKACESCLHLVSQKKTYSTDNNMLKRQPPNENYQMLPWYVGEYKPKTSIISFQTAKKVVSC